MRADEIVSRLHAAGIDTAEFDASVLIEHFEGVSPALQKACDRDYCGEELTEALLRRERREPLQYIIGEWDFMGHTYRVTPDCLIPRQDTETLCELLINTLPARGRFLDLCTGSGCIAISALLLRPDATAAAVDISPAALDIARENAARHKVTERLELFCADVREGCTDKVFDMIVSNPPYITAEEMKEISPELMSEPEIALTDGGDGLSVIRKIIEIYPALLSPGGILAIETGCRQAAEVMTIAHSFGLEARFLQDAGKRDRVAVITATTGGRI